MRFDNDVLSAILRSPDDISGLFNGRGSGQHPREHVSASIWSPPVDVYEDSDAIIIKADLPGLEQDGIDIEMANDTLTIRGERKFEDEAHKDSYVRIERQYGTFQRSFSVGIPIEVATIKATYKNGILELILPKSEVTKPRKVQVSVA